MICRKRCLVLVKKEGPASVQIYALLHDRRHFSDYGLDDDEEDPYERYEIEFDS
jgi:hypothetical protein